MNQLSYKCAQLRVVHSTVLHVRICTELTMNKDIYALVAHLAIAAGGVFPKKSPGSYLYNF